MKLTLKQLKRIIKEELNKTMNEIGVGHGSYIPDAADEKAAEAEVRYYTGAEEAEEEKEDWGDLAPADSTEVWNIDFLRNVAWEIAQAGNGDIKNVSAEQILDFLDRHAKPQG
tara:strand:- start:1443 stop:1781 length:339 start_codon:yes stop_codon:yes gene_type:complete